jgi:DNA replication protein DnaC
MMVHPLLPKLQALKLSGIALSLDNRCTQAAQANFTPLEFLALLLDDELERRHQNRIRQRLDQSGVDERKTLAAFDFAAVPVLNRSLVMELATCSFISRSENVLMCGPTGTGKSHLAHSLGYEALKRGLNVQVHATQKLLAELHAARAGGSFPRRFAKLCSLDLLVLDDFGLRPLSAFAAEDLYELIRERYERKSTVITSNRSFEEWPEVFGDGLLSSAALDRLTHHCHTLVIRGQSYRQRGRRKEGSEPDESYFNPVSEEPSIHP